MSSTKETPKSATVQDSAASQAHRQAVAETRAHLEEWLTEPFKAYSAKYLPAENDYVVQDRTVSVHGGEFAVRTIVPAAEDPRETFPVLVNFHSGGWSAGSIELDDYFLRKVSVDLKLSIVNVDYRLAPEHPFPTAVTDSLAALKWTVSNAALIKADLSKGFIVCGHSAGANIAAVVAHEARNDPFFQGPGRQLTGQIIREPLVIHPDVIPEEFKPEMRSSVEYPPPAFVRLVIELYNPDPLDPRFSPLLYPSHRGLPRAFVQGMGADAFRDDARVYAKVLREAGIESKYIEYPDVDHGFHYSTPETEAAVKVRADLIEGIKWLLGKDV